MGSEWGGGREDGRPRFRSKWWHKLKLEKKKIKRRHELTCCGLIEIIASTPMISRRSQQITVINNVFFFRAVLAFNERALVL
jgi:hypothetical protein